MRLLFSFVDGNGHFLPLVGLARAAIDDGHSVVFVCGPRIADLVRSEGFEILSFGNQTVSSPTKSPLRSVDRERELREFIERFMGETALRKAGAMADAIEAFRPDMVVAEETDLGSIIGAEQMGVPVATVTVLASGSFLRLDRLLEPFNLLRKSAGLGPTGKIHGDLVLSPVPPSYRDPRFPLPEKSFSFRQPMKARPYPKGSNPLVYVTLGTVFNLESGDLFNRVLDGLSPLPVDIVMTIGNHLDPQEFGDQPPNVSIHRYLPQDDVLASASAVVSHGGSGSTLGALAFGLPSVIIPMGADQPWNADRCMDLGCALVEGPVALTPESIRNSVSEVLQDRRYRDVAEGIAAEYQTMPTAKDALGYLASTLRFDGR